MQQLTIGSLFSGSGGLDLAVEDVFDAHTVWQAEWEDAPLPLPNSPNVANTGCPPASPNG